MTDASLLSLLARLARQIVQLVRSELALAEAEGRQLVRRTAIGLGLIVIALVLLIIGLTLAAATAAAALVAAGFSPTAALAMVAGGCVLVAGLAVWRAVALVSYAFRAPQRLRASVRRDLDTFKETFTDDQTD